MSRSKKTNANESQNQVQPAGTKQVSRQAAAKKKNTKTETKNSKKTTKTNNGQKNRQEEERIQKTAQAGNQKQAAAVKQAGSAKKAAPSGSTKKKKQNNNLGSKVKAKLMPGRRNNTPQEKGGVSLVHEKTGAMAPAGSPLKGGGFLNGRTEGTGLKAERRADESLRQKQLEINGLEKERRAKKKEEQQKLDARVASYRGASKGVKPGIGSGSIKIIFLGGLEQIGMNITAFESEESIIVVDCGMAFPDESMPGIDLVIPDVSYLKENSGRVKGFFITHGHEDHIGSLPYVLRDLNVPVYCTRLTRALIEIKLGEAGLLESTRLNTVQFGDVIRAGDFAVEFIKTNHSIQDAAALALHTPAGTILHTGDFKVDYTPVFGDAIDLQRFAELGRQGVLALLCESTNAARPGFTMSERTVGRTFENIFSEYSDRRIVVATFASNVDRVQQVITVAEKHGRKVIIDGRSMVNVIGAAQELGIISIKQGTLIDIGEIRNYPEENTVLIVTGSQGEPMAALSRMAHGQHKKVYLGEKDVIVLSSNPIPGNEKAVYKVIDDLSRRHTKVIYQDTHVSGHACAEDIKLIYSLVRPQFSIPIHGEYRQRQAQRELAMDVGMPGENVLMAETGDVVNISADCCLVDGRVQAGPVLVDGLGVGDIGNIVLKDRQTLAENGIIIAALTIEKAGGEVVSGPDIVTRGFVYVRENEALIDDARAVALNAALVCMRNGSVDIAHIRNVIKDELNEFIWRRMKRQPMILPIISEV